MPIETSNSIEGNFKIIPKLAITFIAWKWTLHFQPLLSKLSWDLDVARRAKRECTLLPSVLGRVGKKGGGTKLETKHLLHSQVKLELLVYLKKNHFQMLIFASLFLHLPNHLSPVVVDDVENL